MPKKLIIFDLDQTLAESKAVLDDEMTELLVKLMCMYKVAVISGGSLEQFKKQFISPLQKFTQKDEFKNLFILPSSGSAMWKFDQQKSEWVCVYETKFTKEEAEKIKQTLEDVIKEYPQFFSEKVYGERIEDRGSQITLSALGQDAPLDEKKKWDPDLTKKTKIADYIRSKLPEFHVGVGGSTSVDVVKKGMGKGYGTLRLLDELNLQKSEAIYIGDALFKGGNDEEAMYIGVETLKVKDPTETKEVIKRFIGLCELN